MKKILFLLIFLLVFAGNIYARMNRAPEYGLSAEEITKVRQLLDAEGYVNEISTIKAYNHGEEIKIEVKSKPITKQRYLQIDILAVKYRDGEMKIDYISRQIKHELTDYYFYVDSDISDAVINKALEKYHSIIKNKTFALKKTDTLRSLYSDDNAYVLLMTVRRGSYDLFRVFLDKVDVTTVIKTEINSMPIF